MKTMLAVLALASAAACTPATNYKTERDAVVQYHDVVMADHGKLLDNKKKLDTLLHSLPALKKMMPELDTLREKVMMQGTLLRLNKAEEQMNDWMHNFEPDVTGKTDAEAIAYFQAEGKKIAKVDSVYKVEIKHSTAYLTKFQMSNQRQAQ